MSFKIVKKLKFPDLQINEEIKTEEQLHIPGHDRPANTSIKLINNQYFGYKYYHITHECIEKESGIAFGLIGNVMTEMPFDYYMHSYDLYAFLDENNNFYVKGSSKIVDNFFSRIKKKLKDDIQFDDISLNLNKLIELCLETTCTWIKKEGSTKIQAIALIGHNVNSDEEYIRLIENNTLSSIIVTPNILGKLLKVQISNDCGLYFIGKYEESELLSFLKELKRNYLDSVVIL